MRLHPSLLSATCMFCIEGRIIQCGPIGIAGRGCDPHPYSCVVSPHTTCNTTLERHSSTVVGILEPLRRHRVDTLGRIASHVFISRQARPIDLFLPEVRSFGRVRLCPSPAPLAIKEGPVNMSREILISTIRPSALWPALGVPNGIPLIALLL